MRTSARTDFRKRRETDFWRTANRLLVLLIVVGGTVIAILTFYPEFRRIDEMNAQIERLDQEVKAEELRLRQQEREEEWLKNDPEYIEMLARERLHLMKEGETIYRLDMERRAPEVPEP